MNKQEFISKLKEALRGLPESDIAVRIDFYCEIIDDKIEEGCAEDEAVASVGEVEKIALEILADIPLSRLAREKIKTKKEGRSATEITLLILGSPIWLPLIVAAAAVLFSLYASAWAVIVSLWAATVGVGASAIAGVAVGIVFAILGKSLSGIALIAAGITLAGLSIFFFFGCRVITNGMIALTQRIALGIKKSLIKKEGKK